MLALHERDRKLIAYEIHDGLAQQLTGALFLFQTVHQQLSQKPEEAGETLDAAVALLSRGIAEARRLISGLRPPILDESGVVAAVEYLVSEQQEDGGPEIEFRHNVRFDRLAHPLETAVFRIVQETLTNARRYSQSKKISIELVQSGNRIHVEVRDWGIGFDPEKTEKESFGLQGVRERARLLGGQAAIHSTPGEGTCITVELPIVESTLEKANNTSQ
ncbi:MAG: sensor histidine kinase [Planctomycetota bacterium]